MLGHQLAGGSLSLSMFGPVGKGKRRVCELAFCSLRIPEFNQLQKTKGLFWIMILEISVADPLSTLLRACSSTVCRVGSVVWQRKPSLFGTEYERKNKKGPGLTIPVKSASNGTKKFLGLERWHSG